MENIITRRMVSNPAAAGTEMRGWTSVSKLIRATAMTLALLVALAVGSVFASNDIGLSECDASGCAIATVTESAGDADFQITGANTVNGCDAHVSPGSPVVGFTP